MDKGIGCPYKVSSNTTIYNIFVYEETKFPRGWFKAKSVVQSGFKVVV
jgi:hypothetical protein